MAKRLSGKASLLCAVCCVLTTGCIRQRLIIRSEPPGAALILNDQRVGTTPYSQPFLWYGWYRLTLEKPGYERMDDRVLFRAPIYFWIPLDFVVELLPFPIRDTKELTYHLMPKAALPEPVPPGSSRPAASH